MTNEAASNPSPPSSRDSARRDQVSSDIERFLEVGMGAIFQSDPHDKKSPRFRTIMRGWERGACMILDLSGYEDRTLILRQHENCLLRFLSDGRACAVDCKVLDWRVNRQNPYFRVSWPHQVRYIAVRKDERLDAEIPVELDDGAETFSGQIQDISVKGCRILATRQPPLGITLEATFTLPDGSVMEKTRYTVRNVSESGGRFILGCEMSDGREEVVSDLHFYVWTAVSRLRSGTGGLERVVAVSHRARGFDAVETAASRQGFTIYRGAGVVEGFCLMRLQPTCAVILDAADLELPPAEVIRVLRSTRGFQETPILVYNLPPAEQAALAASERAVAFGELDDGTVAKMVTALADMTAPPAEE